MRPQRFYEVSHVRQDNSTAKLTDVVADGFGEAISMVRDRYPALKGLAIIRDCGPAVIVDLDK